MNQGDPFVNPPHSPAATSTLVPGLRSLLTNILKASQDAIAAFRAVRHPATGALTDLRCLVVNLPAAELFGRSPSEVGGTFCLRPFLTPTVPALFAALAHVVESGIPLHQEVAWPRNPPAPAASGQPAMTHHLTAMQWGDGLTLILHPLVEPTLITLLAQREAELQALLDSTQAISWQVDWPTQRLTTIGAQIETLLGFPQTSWTDVATWLSRIHADDRAWVESYSLSQSAAGRDHTLEYRFISQEGSVVWVRHTIRVVEQHGQTPMLIGFLFDISDRKLEQSELAHTQLAADQANAALLQITQQLQDLTHVDDLTHLANRRRFDDRLQREWQRLARERQPLSLLLCEIDHFQAYNDAYGQQAGNNRLLQVAQVLKTVARRPSDLVARYREATFAILLPATQQEGALYVAARLQEKLTSLQIIHNLSPTRPYLTLRIGVTQLIPVLERSPETLVSIADAALSRAKREGRNAIVYEPVPEL
ncbi:diguanylate cyclase domain-containing protein [Trichothermofontia sp.]